MPTTTNTRRSVTDLTADLILCESRLREVRALLPAPAAEYVNAAVADVEDALTTLTAVDNE